MSPGSEASQNDGFLKGNERTGGGHLSMSQNSNSDKKINASQGNQQAKAERPNVNNEVLNFNDNYTAILQNLASDSTHLFSNDFSPNDINSPGIVNFRGSHDSNSHRSAEHGGVNEKQNIDVLLQHYQTLLSKSVNPNNSTFKPNTSASAASRTGTPKGYHNHGNNEVHNGNDGKNLNKSVITERPCDHCRARQTKCVIVPNLSNCVQCETKGIKCSLSGLSDNGYGPSDLDMKHPRSSDGETLDGNSKRIKPNNGINTENVAQYYTELLQNLNESMSSSNNPSHSNQQRVSSPHKTPSNAHVTGMPHSNQSQDVQQRQHFSSPQSHGQYPRSSFYVGATSVYDINLVNHIKLDHIDQIQLSPAVALRRVAPNVQFILRDNFNQQLYIQQEHEIDMVEKLVYPHGRVLVDIFFKLIHPHFPILHERVFLEKYSRSYRELTAPLLASVYSLSLQWWDFHPKLIGFPKPEVTEQLNGIAYRTFFDMIERPKLSMVQTGLLILQCRSECPNNWVLNSAVVALAEELGLGVDCHDWRLPRWERGLRRRLAWAVWSQDKWTALLESRPSHLIFGRNWMVKMLSEEDFPTNSPVIKECQETNTKLQENPLSSVTLFDMFPTNEDFLHGTLMFQQLISLSVILGEIMDTFYTEGAMQVTSKIEQVLKLAKPLQLKLREWYHSLPSKLSMNRFVARKFNANATLTLAYFAAEITLHRKIITTLRQDTPKELVQVCRTAAKTRLVAAIEFVRDLKNEHINAFWYTCSTGNLMLIGTFAALLYVTSKTKDESIIFRDCLRNYIWILRVGSKSFDRSSNALNRIHILLTQIPGLLTDEQPKEFMPARSQSPLYNTQQWKSGSSVDFQQSPPNLNQLRTLPAELLQALSNMQGNSPKMNGNKNVNSSSSPAYSNTQRSDINGHYYGDVNVDSTEKSIQDNNVSLENFSPENVPSISKRASDSASNVLSEEQDNTQNTQPTHDSRDSPTIIDSNTQGKLQERGLNLVANQNFKGKPITPQSVNGANAMKMPTPLTNNDNNSENISNHVSTISPESVQDKRESNCSEDSHRADKLDGPHSDGLSPHKSKNSDSDAQENVSTNSD